MAERSAPALSSIKAGRNASWRALVLLTSTIACAVAYRAFGIHVLFLKWVFFHPVLFVIDGLVVLFV
jgi:hypothetical protein